MTILSSAVSFVSACVSASQPQGRNLAAFVLVLVFVFVVSFCSCHSPFHATLDVCVCVCMRCALSARSGRSDDITPIVACRRSNRIGPLSARLTNGVSSPAAAAAAQSDECTPRFSWRSNLHCLRVIQPHTDSCIAMLGADSLSSRRRSDSISSRPIPFLAAPAEANKQRQSIAWPALQPRRRRRYDSAASPDGSAPVGPVARLIRLGCQLLQGENGPSWNRAAPRASPPTADSNRTSSAVSSCCHSHSHSNTPTALLVPFSLRHSLTRR